MFDWVLKTLQDSTHLRAIARKSLKYVRLLKDSGAEKKKKIWSRNLLKNIFGGVTLSKPFVEERH